MFTLFFDNVFQSPVLQTQVGRHLFKAQVLLLKIFDLFNIRSLNAAISGLRLYSVASEITASRQTSLTVRPDSID